MSEKQRFQEILQEIRSNLNFLQVELFKEVINLINQKIAQVELRDWLFDVFLDKFFETDVKIRKIISDLGYEVEFPWKEVKRQVEKIACQHNISHIRLLDINSLKFRLKDYADKVESEMSSIRYKLHENNWEQINKLRTEDYVLPTQRVKYVQARDELEKAKKAVKAEEWDEVLNHLRPAIDLAMKEKFGFKKIQPMKTFLKDAEKYGLPLPTYTMLYDYFDEGSQRIHEGKLNTPYECQKALEFVAGFIDRLDLVNISQEEINDFKSKSKAVE